MIYEDIERSGRDTYYALQLEKRLTLAGIPLFATDEPIDMAGANSTTVLVRRVKQGVAEWFRLQIKEKAGRGLREHSPGRVEHRRPAVRVPGRACAAPGAHKSLPGPHQDPPGPGPRPRPSAVAAIFTWRTEDKLGGYAIATRLNNRPGLYPPPRGGK